MRSYTYMHYKKPDRLSWRDVHTTKGLGRCEREESHTNSPRHLRYSEAFWLRNFLIFLFFFPVEN